MTRPEAEILTVAHLAEIFGCDAETVAAKLISGDLPGLKIGRSWIIPRQAFLQRLNTKALEDAAARRDEKEKLETNFKKLGQAKDEIHEFSNKNPFLPSRKNIRGRPRRTPPELPRPPKIE